MYYDVMESREDASRGAYAKKAIAAYASALEINPDNLDIRTDMAIAYMYDPDNPMKAIQETNRVLEQDSLHVQANFNRGVMLANINRIDQAVAQFRKVQRIVGDDSSPIYQRAEQAIDRLQGVPQ
jgi:cytochrome c-type biogenesis protein CcmH/NrfG